MLKKTAAPASSANSVFVGMRHCSSKPSKPPAIVTAMHAGDADGERRNFRIEPMRDEIARGGGECRRPSPSNAQTSNEPGVGLTMNSVPMSPTAIAVQRRQPTTSLNSMTDNAVRIRGDASTIDSQIGEIDPHQCGHE